MYKTWGMSFLLMVQSCFLIGEIRELPLDVCVKKMEKNAKKAIEEHRKKDKDAYISFEDLDLDNKIDGILSFECFASEEQGIRLTMEDAHFFQNMEEGIFLGVLDGHGGKEVAEYASTFLQKNFQEILNQTKKNVHRTFEILIEELHEHVAKKGEWNAIGTTAVLCFIDKCTHQIYTATVGDSEANLYRKINSNLQSIPLSCIRDWSYPKEAKRAALFLNNPEIAINWPKVTNPKVLRYPKKYYGINLSRSIGDVIFTGAVIHKPKITVQQVRGGDILILACDGLKDYVLEREIISQIEKQPGYELADQLAQYAVRVKKSQDNVTVLVLYLNEIATQSSDFSHGVKERLSLY